MFEVGKPRQFHYEPRFYDPEKEKLEALEKKYQYLRSHDEAAKEVAAPETDTVEDDETNISYFERRLRDLDEEKRVRSSRLTWRDMFRKREMPQFHYEPRFQGMQTASTADGAVAASSDGVDATGAADQAESLVRKYAPKHQIKIKRRYDISDPDYMKPMPASKILLYAGIVCVLILAIFFL